MKRFLSRTLGSCTLQLVVVAASAGAAFAGATTQVRDRAGIPATMAFPGTNGVIITTADGSSFDSRSTFTFDLESDDGGGFAPFLSYCTEIDTVLGFETNPPDTVGQLYDVTNLGSDPRFNATEVDQLERLWNNAITDSLTTEEKAAAFQALVWELSIDNTLNLLAGDFRLDTSDDFTDDVNTQASFWITKLGDGSWPLGVPLQQLTSPDSQDLLRQVPEPASLCLLAVGGLLAARRRRR